MGTTIIVVAAVLCVFHSTLTHNNSCGCSRVASADTEVEGGQVTPPKKLLRGVITAVLHYCNATLHGPTEKITQGGNCSGTLTAVILFQLERYMGCCQKNYRNIWDYCGTLVSVLWHSYTAVCYVNISIVFSI